MKAETDKCINCKYFTGSINWFPRYWSCEKAASCDKHNNYCEYVSITDGKFTTKEEISNE